MNREIKNLSFKLIIFSLFLFRSVSLEAKIKSGLEMLPLINLKQADNVLASNTRSEASFFSQDLLSSIWQSPILKFLLLTAVIIFIISFLIKKFYTASNYLSTGEDVDINSRELSKESVLMRFVNPGERLLNLSYGVLKNKNSKKYFKSIVEFGNGRKRMVLLKARERVASAIIEDNEGFSRVCHIRNACTHRYGSGLFVIPDNWSILYDEVDENKLNDLPLYLKIPKHVIKRSKNDPLWALDYFNTLAKELNKEHKECYEVSLSTFKKSNSSIEYALKFVAIEK